MLDEYTCKCKGINNNINNSMKEPTCGCQDCNTKQILIFDGYVKVRESLYTQVIIRVNIILSNIDNRVKLS